MVEFPTIGDLSIQHRGRKILIECKRPSSSRGIKENIEKALEQLTFGYINHEDSFGLIFVSINKILNPDQNLYIQKDINALSKNLPALVQKFVKENLHIWQNKKDGRTLGVIISLQVPAIIEDEQMLVIGREMIINNMTYQDTAEHDLLLDVAKEMTKMTK